MSIAPGAPLCQHLLAATIHAKHELRSIVCVTSVPGPAAEVARIQAGAFIDILLDLMVKFIEKMLEDKIEPNPMPPPPTV